MTEAIGRAADEAPAAGTLVDLVRGARLASDVLREFELEAARQARIARCPAARLASATDMAERSAASHYKSPA
jgi:hypothetical protein